MDGRDEFLKLFLKHEADLRAFIGSLLLDPNRREDVLQEVALTLWQQLDAYDRQRSFGAWARGVAANKILQQRAQDARFPVLFSPVAIQAVLEAYDRTEAEASHKADALRECLKELPEPSRQLLALRYERELRPESIAQRTGRTLDAVYQALSRIRGRLEECIRRRLALEVLE